MWCIPILEIVLGLVALTVIVVSHWKYKWRIRSSVGRLPPGSMGLPFIGETIDFFMPSKSIDIPPFLKKRTERYTYFCVKTYALRLARCIVFPWRLWYGTWALYHFSQPITFITIDFDSWSILKLWPTVWWWWRCMYVVLGLNFVYVCVFSGMGRCSKQTWWVDRQWYRQIPTSIDSFFVKKGNRSKCGTLMHLLSS